MPTRLEARVPKFKIAIVLARDFEGVVLAPLRLGPFGLAWLA